MILVDDNDDIDDDDGDDYNNEKEKFHIFMSLTFKKSVFFYTMSHNLLLICKVFGAIRCLHRQG